MKKSTFFKRLIDLEMMDENGSISLRIKDVKDWPEDLDIENWEIDSVSPGEGDDEKGEGYISGYAGGDWQDSTRFTILIPATGKPHCKMFDDPSCFAGKNIYKELKSLVKKELKEAQFKTKKRKIARSYEERRKLANRKRFNEGEDVDKKYESFFRKASEQEINMLKKIGFHANEYTLVVRDDAFNSMRQNRDLNFIYQGFLECDSNVHYSSGDLDFEFCWYRSDDDELYSCADLIKDYPNIAKVYHVDDPEVVTELGPEELTKKDIDNDTDISVVYMDTWARDYGDCGDSGLGNIFVTFSYGGEKPITLEEFLKMNKMSREELLAAIVAETEDLGEKYMEQIVNYQD